MKNSTTWLSAIIGLVPFAAMAEVDEKTAIAVMQETAIWSDLAAVSSDISQTLVVYTNPRVLNVVVPAPLASVLQRSNSHVREDSRFAAIDSMRMGLDATTVVEVRRWIKAPLGQKILALEKSRDVLTYSFEGIPATGSQDIARDALLVEIVDARKLIEGTRAVNSGNAGVVASVRAAVDPARAIPKPEFTELSPAFKEFLQRNLAAKYGVVYGSLSTEELREYLQYLRSPAAVRLTNLTISTLSVVMKDLVAEFDRQLESVKPRNGAD